MSINLEEATHDYWTVSRAYEGHETITTEDAIRALGKHLEYLNPERKIFRHMEELQGCIIVGDKRKTTAYGTNPCTEIPVGE